MDLDNNKQNNEHVHIQNMELVETNAKIKECGFFLDKMIKQYHGDDLEFEYYFHAFLHVWRSVFDVMLEDYQKLFKLEINLIEKLDSKTFKKYAIHDHKALAFYKIYKCKINEIFGFANWDKLIEEKFIDENLTVIKLLTIALNKSSINELNQHTEDCLPKLADIVISILGWNLSLLGLKRNPWLITQSKDVGVTEELLTEFFQENNLRNYEKTLKEIFSREFLQQSILKNKQFQTNFSEDNFVFKIPILTVSGYLRIKRNLRTHRRGTSREGNVISTNSGGETLKLRFITLIDEIYSDKQIIPFGYERWIPHEVRMICEFILKRTERFILELNHEFKSQQL